MNLRVVSTFAFGFALCAAACAQDANPAPQQNQNPAMGQESGPGMGGGYGERGGRGGMGMGMMGRGVTGTVTAVAADQYTVKSFTGETYTVHFSANTRMMKQPAGGREGMRGGMGRGQGGGGWRGQGGGNPPQQIKATDIKVGDFITAMGEVDANAKSVGAVGIMLLDPERAKQMQQLEADYGKTWLMGKVTAINGAKVTIQGSLDDQPHTIVADENTDFRERRDPITLADIKVGDTVRAEGAVKGGAFTAATVNVMRMQPNGRGFRDRQPQ